MEQKGQTRLRSLVSGREEVLWEGRPNKKCFLLETVFNPLLIIAAIWLVLDLSFMIPAFQSGVNAMTVMMGGFFLLHLMPVWLYLAGVIFSVRRYHNTAFLITDRGIYISGGILTYRYEMKPFTDISHVLLHRGIFDQFLGVGDVQLVCGHQHEGNTTPFAITDISDYEKVFQMVNDLQTDIYADTMYPNDLRPEENHGYRTKYRGR